ncbi:unnamed protein product [Eruca vesicaria subsp. sativa]|uniref:Rho termination factor-like N-terminal domain-containing protein n=1 Tax=Eruca vesicaria subsp. sativa TaxID=29727 RepID=A0ABC8LPI5_ERUVS|nr:unnamed protein product [Eruca vesicaria subsp. sativa]
MDDDDVDDLWGPPLVVKDDTFRKLPLRGCEFWFDFRTDVLEESFQIERYCELVWRILNEKKQVVEIDELDKDVASSGNGDIGGSSDSDKTLLSATLPDADTSSAKSSVDEDENTSSISDALTSETKGSTNDTEDARLKPHETEANDEITVEVVEDVDTSLSPVLESKIEVAEEHSCSSLVTHQVFDPIKQAPENKSPSATSHENNGGSTLTPLVETREKANATNEDGEVLKDEQQQKQSDSLQVIETASEPFTTESLLEMCEEPEKVSEALPCDDEKSKRSMPEAVKTVVKDEPIMNMLTETRVKIENTPLLNPSGAVLTKKRKRISNTSLIRNTKQKAEGGAGEVNTTPPTESKPKGPSVPPPLSASTLDLIDRIRQRCGKTMGEPVILLSELNDKTGKELRGIAKELKVTHYYKMKKEDLLQHCIMQLKLKLKLADCKEQRMES